MTLNERLSSEKAQKEIKRFAILGFVLSLVSLFVFGWLGVASLALSARALVVTGHEANKDHPKRSQYRVLAVIGLVVSVADIVLVFGMNR